MKAVFFIEDFEIQLLLFFGHREVLKLLKCFYMVQSLILNILLMLSKIAKKFNKKRSNTMTLHMGNACLHRSKDSQYFASKNGLSFCPHPEFSPDLAPSDFNLFGNKIKKKKHSSFPPHFPTYSEILKHL